MSVVQYPAGVSTELKTLLLDCAEMCNLAYSQPSNVQQQWSKAQEDTNSKSVLRKVFKVPKFVECVCCDAQSYLMRYKAPAVEGLEGKEVLTIVARGTSSLTDFMCDGDISQTQFRDASDKSLAGVKVHAGFYRQFIGLFSMFDTEIKEHLDKGGHLLCTGHSLGSSNATLAALNYASSHPGQVYFVGYGCPRVGNKAFADAFNKCVKMRIRVKNCSDPIASILPPVCGYTHVGYELHLGTPDQMPQVPNLFCLGDHGIVAYQKNICEPVVAATTIPQVTKSWYLTVVDAFRWQVETTKQ